MKRQELIRSVIEKLSDPLVKVDWKSFDKRMFTDNILRIFCKHLDLEFKYEAQNGEIIQ
jgi:hypothetical protein